MMFFPKKITENENHQQKSIKKYRINLKLKEKQSFKEIFGFSILMKFKEIVKLSKLFFMKFYYEI